jgi:hypothetical protein
VTSASCGDPVEEFVRDVTSGRRFQQKEPTMTSESKAKSRLSGRMLPILRPDAAGIDIGAEEVFVADRDIDSRSLWKETIVPSICSRFASPWQHIGSIST